MHVLFVSRMRICNPARMLGASVYTFPAQRSWARLLRKRQFVQASGIHFRASLAPPEVMRSKKTPNARSSLGCSAIDVKRFCAGFAFAKSSCVVNFTRVLLRVCPTANCILQKGSFPA